MGLVVFLLVGAEFSTQDVAGEARPLGDLPPARPHPPQKDVNDLPRAEEKFLRHIATFLVRNFLACLCFGSFDLALMPLKSLRDGPAIASLTRCGGWSLDTTSRCCASSRLRCSTSLRYAPNSNHSLASLSCG